MPSKKTAKAAARVKFKDLGSKKNPKGGIDVKTFVANPGWDVTANKKT